MCQFVSWVEKPTNKGKKILFLTHKLIYNTPRGEMIQKQFPGEGELIGHAAIRAYFDYPEGGVEKECTDFSSPKNFPAVIVKAIKRGELRGFPCREGLLGQPALAEYEKIGQPALVEYEKIRQQAWAEYEKIRQQAWAEYEKIRQPALAEYEKIRQQAFWDLFANPENRAEAWR